MSIYKEYGAFNMFNLQVVSILPTKFRANWPMGVEAVVI